MPHNNEALNTARFDHITPKSDTPPLSHKETNSTSIRVVLPMEKYTALTKKAAMEGKSVELLVAQEIERLSQA